MFWGENLIDAIYDFTIVAPVNKRYRINTTWRVSETGDIGTVNFSVNASNLDFTGAPGGILKLVRSTVSDFSTVAEEYNLTLSGGVYSSTVSFDDNDYFTLEIVPTSDLSLTKTVDNALPKVGNIIKFTLSLTNNGPQNATGVIVKDELPTGLQYSLADSTISTGTYNEIIGEWNVGAISSQYSVKLCPNPLTVN